MVESLCAPALIFLILTVIQILIDIFKTYYHDAFMKFLSMILITLLLNILCKKGLATIAWLMVFIPFILMTIISIILVAVFGLNPAEGDYTVNVEDVDDDNVDDDNDDDDNDDDDNDDDDNDDDIRYNNNDSNGNGNNTDYDKKIIIVNPKPTNNNVSTINITHEGEIDVDEGMLNYSKYSPSSNARRRGNNKKNNSQPAEMENTNVNTFLKNMYNKIM